jgi:hypothetical protein
MKKNDLVPNDGDDFGCHLQKIEIGGLICSAARRSGGDLTNRVNAKICFNCDVGKIYRDIGCDSASSNILIYRHSSGLGTSPFLQQDMESIFCSIRKRETTIENCKQCNLVVASTTKTTISEARGLLEEEGFYTAYKSLEEARKELRDGKFEHVITLSITFLESTMKICHDRLGETYPDKEAVSTLWKSTREILKFDSVIDEDSFVMLLDSISGGLINRLGGIRNSLSDSHGVGDEDAEVPFMIAELALNLSSALSTLIIRRFKQIGVGGKDERSR